MRAAAPLLLCAGGAAAAPAADAVTSLPDYGVPPTPQYSGFLDASAAEPGTHLHYWFAAAEGGDWESKPVVLWLNGGPGSSSLVGMLQEEGPLVVGRSGALIDNPYAWTKIANLVALESPAGVGYSYCAAMRTGGACSNTDKSTAKAAHAALVDFFTNKFPELRAPPFFITGESYAGVYCPTLAAEIVAGNNASGAAAINLVGMAVGDPCTDNAAQKQSMDMLWYAHKYGLVPEAEYDFLKRHCNATHAPALAAGRWASVRHPARAAATVAPAAPAAARVAGEDPKCKVALRKYLLASSKGISQSWDKAFVNELAFYDPAGPYRFDLPGTLNYHTAQYMMRADVKKALHVDAAPVSAWPGPPPGWQYASDYDACNDAVAPGTDSMVDFYRRLAPQLAGKIVVFNGDTDPCVSYEGTRAAIEKVGFGVTQPYRAWFFNYTAADAAFLEKKDLLFGPKLSLQAGGPQYGGSIVDYEHGLSFATVHGSGHMVPTFRPRAALQLLEHVVRGTPFSAPVPADADIAAMGDGEWDQFLDTWVGDAKSATYVHER